MALSPSRKKRVSKSYRVRSCFSVGSDGGGGESRAHCWDIVLYCAWREFHSCWRLIYCNVFPFITVDFGEELSEDQSVVWHGRNQASPMEGKVCGGSPGSDSSTVCDSSPSERLTPILVGYGINTLFYVGRQRSMDLPFPERKHSIFSGWFHGWISDTPLNGYVCMSVWACGSVYSCSIVI